VLACKQGLQAYSCLFFFTWFYVTVDQSGIVDVAEALEDIQAYLASFLYRKRATLYQHII